MDALCPQKSDLPVSSLTDTQDRRHCFGSPVSVQSLGYAKQRYPVERRGRPGRAAASAELRLSRHHPARPRPDLDLTRGSPGPCSVVVGTQAWHSGSRPKATRLSAHHMAPTDFRTPLEGRW